MNPPTVLFYGDSRAADWPFPSLPGAKFVNRGVPGDDTAGALHRVPFDLLPHNPAVVLLQLGINDLAAGVFYPDRRATVVKRCRSNIEELVQRCLSTGATVLLSTIFPTASSKFDFWALGMESIAPDVETVNDFLRGLAGKRVMIFETEEILAEDGQVRLDFAADMLHLNRAGYAALNKALVPVLEQLLTGINE